jgi:MarR family transcriptional regulator, transcriptional regulator for hemolysin
MSEASAGRLIDRLCAEGLLQRQERFDDRRARAVYLTPQAEPLLAKLSAIGKEGEERIFSGFSEAELANLEALLDRVYRNLA